MKEVGLNPASSAQASERTQQARAVRRAETQLVAPTDTIEGNLTRTTDFSSVEKNTEARFDMLKARLRQQVNHPDYPPLETIEKLSKLFALPSADQAERERGI